MNKLDKTSIEEIKWFINEGQIRPRLLTNLYRISKEELQQIINAHILQ